MSQYLIAPHSLPQKDRQNLSLPKQLPQTLRRVLLCQKRLSSDSPPDSQESHKKPYPSAHRTVLPVRHTTPVHCGTDRPDDMHTP